MAHNYELFKHLEDFKLFGLPLLVGISRKSMIYKLLDSSPEEALNGTTVLNTIALTKGADILRVHDVKACVEAVRIFNQMNEQKIKKHFHAIRIRIERLIDIFLVALMLFYCYKVMKESRSLNVFFGVLIFVVFWLFVSQILEMKLLGSILDKLVSVGTLALIILFQEEIRNFFFTIGTHRQVESLLKLIRRNKKDNKKTNKDDIMPIVMACMSMSKQKVGALIVIERNLPLNDIIRSGELIDANINQRLIENIFFQKTVRCTTEP